MGKGPKDSTARWAVIGLLWAALVSAGGTLLWNYARTAGTLATPPGDWPSQSVIVRTPGTATLIMLAHPRCPCTRASIAELRVLMSRIGEKARAHVLFVRPVAVSADWEKTPLFQSAVSIPGVTVHTDVGGVESARFQAATSGQTVVYDANGRLIFRGGITGSRGHEGDNVGRARIVSLLTRGQADDNESQVFGCALEKRAEMKGNARP